MVWLSRCSRPPAGPTATWKYGSRATCPWKDRRRPRRRAEAPSPAAAANAGSTSSDDTARSSGSLPSFLQNPAIAQRELLRQFYMASSNEEQLRLLEQAAGQPLDLGTSLQMLCHTADLSLKGVLPGAVAEQNHLMRTIHGRLEGSLASLQPIHLATTLWSYAVVGVTADWTDALLQQVAEQELGANRLERYNTKELTSLLYAYGRLLRRRSPEVQRFGAALAAELAKRWDSVPYVKAAFSSTDFADVAEACATLFGGSQDTNVVSSSSRGGGSMDGSQGSAGATGIRGSGSGFSSGARPRQSALGRLDHEQAPPSLPEGVSALLELVAGEVRRQLANKHSLRSPWSPRDLVRLARAYAVLGHCTARTAQMLDVLSSFCVQRIRSRHLNCVSRPADLTGLLEAYADLQHSSVAVPELLAAVGDQVRRGAAQQQEQLGAAPAAPTALGEESATSAPASPIASGAASAAAAASAALAVSSRSGSGQLQVPAAGAAAGGSPQASQQQQQQQQHVTPQAAPTESFSIAGITSLLDSHLRLGYQPPPLLLHCLAPQIRRQLPHSRAADAAGLLLLLAEVPLNPGSAVVAMLLGRVEDVAGGGGSAASEGELVLAARQAANLLLHEVSTGG